MDPDGEEGGEKVVAEAVSIRRARIEDSRPRLRVAPCDLILASRALQPISRYRFRPDPMLGLLSGQETD
jgi:hypothetical protein